MPPRPPSPSPSARTSNWPALTLVVVIVLAYGGTWNAPFVYDDTLAIPENPTIRQLWPLSRVLLPQAEGGLTVSGRPVLNLSFALNYAVSGKNPWSYHVFNVLVHAAAALALGGIVRRTLMRPRAVALGLERHAGAASALAFAIAALWALHPLLTQAVTYTVQRAESLMGLFYLLTLYGFVRAAEATDQQQRRRWYGAGVAACALGMGTKEVMATAPLLVLLYDRTFAAGSFRAAWQQRRGFYIALAATWLVLGALVLSTGGNRGGTVGLGVGVPLWAYPLTQFQAVARYLGLSLWPHPLVFEYGTFWVQRAADFVPYALVVVPLLAGTVVALRRWPALGFCGAWFFLILAPTSLAPGTIQMIVEHRMYLPLIAVIATGVVTAHARLGRNVWPVLAVIGIVFGGLTLLRNRDYRSHLALWSDTIAKRPHNPRAHEGLAEAFAELGRLDEALQHRQEAIRLLPDESTYHYNLALTFADAGRLEDAVRHYQLALRLTPNEARTHNNLAILLGKLGQRDAALSHHAEAVRLKPNAALYHYNHGVALMGSGEAGKAAASYETALRLQPDYADAHFNLGAACVKLNRFDDALAHYREAVRLRPADPEYRAALAGALLLAKRPTEALAEFRRALAAKPDSVDALFGTGNALAALHRFDEAIVHYEALLRQTPNHANARFKLGNVLLDVDRVPEAAQQYEIAVQLSPNDAEAHHNLGVAYARLERWSDARTEFETALRFKPDYADARRNLEQLKAVLGR